MSEIVNRIEEQIVRQQKIVAKQKALEEVPVEEQARLVRLQTALDLLR
jgi:hypothetical protein